MISTTCEFKINTPNEGDRCGETAEHFSMARVSYCPEHMLQQASRQRCAKMNHTHWLPARCGKPAKGLDIKGDWMCGIHLNAAKKRQDRYDAWLTKREDAKRAYAERQVNKEETQLICDELRRSFDIEATANDDGTVIVGGAKVLAALKQQAA